MASVCAEIVGFTYERKEIKLAAEPMIRTVNTKQEDNQIWNDLNWLGAQADELTQNREVQGNEPQD